MSTRLRPPARPSPLLLPLALLFCCLCAAYRAPHYAQSKPNKQEAKPEPKPNPNAKAIIETVGPKSMKDADDEAVRKGKKKPYKQPPTKKTR